MKMDKEIFSAVRKNGDGDIESFRTSSGRELTYEEAISEVNNGNVLGANVFKGKDGEMYIRGNADGDPTNNLDALPTYE
ncbi:hypothetical protein N781_04340 [Pontibacillus halophilus JSM 076056 = DSM 19796]|uniref:DUF3892 domain-containing protein n=2 Tax=Pontibacillus TaxID=289201 RepID=A0A0A5GJH5_9BACI|nr:DUF3892 domain-containing protein [Pontibacillus halophilus]KGX91305.1 hypothetical protein N781_04340 [Pontibacillus halophilus JSM 076056 = DSM 19796]